MTIFESINNNSTKAVELGEAYLKSSHEYYKLKIFEQMTISLSLIMKMILIGGLLFVGFLFLVISGTIALGYLLDNMALGCLIVGSIFALLGFTAYMFRYLISKKVIQIMSPKFFN